MDIVKAFNANNLHTDITINGTDEEPLFRASDIALILEISNISKSMKDFNSEEKVITLSNTLGGRQEMLFLTELGLYRLLGQSRKPIAKDFQRWVAKIIKEIRLKGKYELENEKQKLENALNEKDLELAKYQKKNKEKYDKRDRVYVYEDFTNDNATVYKVGYSTNMNSRVDTYDTIRFENRLKYEIVCSNGKLLETMVHNILKVKQDCEKKEWFHTSFAIIKNTIVLAQFILDNLITTDMTDENILNNLLNLNKSLNIYNIHEKKFINENSNEIINENANKNINEFINENTSVIIAETPIVKSLNKITIFDNFFKECCIIGEDYKSTSNDIYGVYRKWNNGCAKTERTDLLNYIKDKFKFTKICNNETKKNEAGYRGFKLIESVYIPKDKDLTIYDKFIIEKCYINHNARTTTFDLTKKLIEWIKTNNDNKEINEKQVTREFKKHLTDHFVPVSGGFIYNGKQECGGFYGICLKECKEHNKFTVNSKNQKTVYKVDPETKNLIESYPSLIVASNTLNNDMYYKVKNKVIHNDGFLYTYDKP